MQLRVSFDPTEEPMACAMGDEEGRKWPQMRAARNKSASPIYFL